VTRTPDYPAQVQIYIEKGQERAKESGYPDTGTGWTCDGWGTENGRREQWRIFAYHQRHQ